ncbi:MAG: 4a-hydroxytetrahydrobiopterin dehydratase [Alphaproteobacteria bacterium]
MMVTDTMLSQKKCAPCAPGTDPIHPDTAKSLLIEIPGWELAIEGRAIRRRFQFKDFMSALAFVQKLAPVAEAEGHHPDIMLGWGYVECVLWTHSITGLHQNDFIMASKINELA